MQWESERGTEFRAAQNTAMFNGRMIPNLEAGDGVSLPPPPPAPLLTLSLSLSLYLSQSARRTTGGY